MHLRDGVGELSPACVWADGSSFGGRGGGREREEKVGETTRWVEPGMPQLFKYPVVDCHRKANCALLGKLVQAGYGKFY